MATIYAWLFCIGEAVHVIKNHKTKEKKRKRNKKNIDRKKKSFIEGNNGDSLKWETCCHGTPLALTKTHQSVTKKY